MNVFDAIAEIQFKPRGVAAYRYLVKHYDKLGYTNEAEAFRELIRIKLHGSHGTDRGQEQQKYDTQDLGIDTTSRL